MTRAPVPTARAPSAARKSVLRICFQRKRSGRQREGRLRILLPKLQGPKPTPQGLLLARRPLPGWGNASETVPSRPSISSSQNRSFPHHSAHSSLCRLGGTLMELQTFWNGARFSRKLRTQAVCGSGARIPDDMVQQTASTPSLCPWTLLVEHLLGSFRESWGACGICCVFFLVFTKRQGGSRRRKYSQWQG